MSYRTLCAHFLSDLHPYTIRVQYRIFVPNDCPKQRYRRYEYTFSQLRIAPLCIHKAKANACLHCIRLKQ